MQRPASFGTRIYMTDEEFADRAKQRTNARDVDNARTGTFRNEEGSRDFSYTSMVIDPPDGRVPALTAAARARPRAQGSFGVGPWEKVQDFGLYDRCITRGAIGSFMPAVYGNGARIIQTPDSVVISYEMVHDTRVIPLDGRPVLGSNLHLLMGDSRGHYEGDTLVIESRNFTNRTAVGGTAHSQELRMVERFTRIDPQMIDYEIHDGDARLHRRASPYQHRAGRDGADAGATRGRLHDDPFRRRPGGRQHHAARSHRLRSDQRPAHHSIRSAAAQPAHAGIGARRDTEDGGDGHQVHRRDRVDARARPN